MSVALSVSNLAEVNSKVKAWFGAVEDAARDAVVGLAQQTFEQILETGPQSSGDFVANTRVSVGGIDYTFEPFVLNNTTHNLFKMGDEPAQNKARLSAAAVWATIKLGTTGHISSTAKHDDFYSWKIENNEIAFRPENAGAYAIYRRAVMHVGQEFKTVGKVQLEALQKVFL